MEVSIVIPSLNPDKKLLEVIHGLLDVGFQDIILVNDGSDAAHMDPFRQAQALPQVTLLTHPSNLGKGRALKTGFSYFLEQRPESAGVVTVDGDGQHAAKDILACAREMVRLGDYLVLGVRDFSQPQVPRHNRWGNRLTCGALRLVCGVRVRDTQTGLRAIPAAHLRAFLQTRGERFEYETEMLLETRRLDIPIAQVTIDTVYQGETQTSHFRVVRDSFLIYRMILRFAVSSLGATAVDFLLYSGILLLLDGRGSREVRLLAAYLTARIISSAINYTVNRKAVFRSLAPVGQTLRRYYLLCVCQTACSYGLIYLLTELSRAALAGEILWKVPVDVLLFLISYQIQRRWVFARIGKNSSKS
ncbi:MAG: bifunctional glycosyltransferase family 2/GtrA family protein [Oscillospiraceae bacterium]|nr:bifunctional glycosyltransferase family 2/GtrA family protein [Oscillospiraceae bacterium]